MTDYAAIDADRDEIRKEHLRADRPASSARGVHHVALLSSDVRRTIEFYQGVLEFPLTEIFENRDYQGSNHFFFDIGNGNLLAFFDFPGLGLEPVPEGIGGVQHVAISVTPDVFERSKGVLAQHGIDYIGPDRGVHESVYFKDPDGIQIELIRQPLMTSPESAPAQD